MAHDYKHAAKSSSSSSPSNTSSLGWLWFVSGLSVGLFVALLVYLSTQYSAGDGAQRAGGLSESAVESESLSDNSSGKSSSAPAQVEKGTDQTKKGAAGGGGRPEPQFEFYTILPEREIRVPEHELRPQEFVGEEEDSALAAAAGNYVLQVGSFRHLGDADQLKAALVLNGFEVEIQAVPADNNDTWYRVRLGPYQDLDVVHEIRSELQKSGFLPLVLREKF